MELSFTVLWKREKGRNGIKLLWKSLLLSVYIYIYYRDLKNITGEVFGFTGGSVQLEKKSYYRLIRNIFFQKSMHKVPNTFV